MSRSQFPATDRGQTLPIYIWTTGILLFVAFGFFAFAQAASARNGAQSAADAAALAAAQASREEMLDGLATAIGGEEDWLDWLTGDLLEEAGAQTAAEQLAGENDASVTGFGPAEVNGYPGFQVEIETNYTVGESIIPGTESMRARAQATAVLEPRCEFDVDADPRDVIELDCDGETVEIDPQEFRPEDLPDASDLFSVYLAE
ncbi:pilus assembly protein TadG-related protein [Streptomyces sp. NPDC059816]|uniref:pilus assembly protein TadG-related protein n=1 Tax=Streptomyces sp. NPDC059816 TaxID=3346960 RepID=UPI00364E2DE0